MKTQAICKLAGDLRELPYRELLAVAAAVSDALSGNTPTAVAEALLAASDKLNPPAAAPAKTGGCPRCPRAKSGPCRSYDCRWKD